MKNPSWMQSGRRLLMAYLLGMAACVGQAPDDPSDISAESLAKPKPPGDAPGTVPVSPACAPILQLNCKAKPLTAAQLQACEQDKLNRYNDCVRDEKCTAQFEAAVDACGPKPVATSVKRPAFDTCVQKAGDVFDACVGPSDGPGTL